MKTISSRKGIVVLLLFLSAFWSLGLTKDHDQTFRFNLVGEPETLDPAFATGVPEANVLTNLFEGLTVLDPKTLEIKPGAAKSWEITNEGKTYTFHLRTNLFWTNGGRLTANDFVYAWKRVLEKSTASPYAYYLFYIKGAEKYNSGDEKDFSKVGLKALADDRLQVELRSPTAYFLFLTSYHTLSPLHQKTVEKHGVQWTRPQNIVSNGPFRMTVWKPNSQIVLERNEKYWDASKVRLERIEALPIVDIETGLRMYQQGKLHWTGNSNIPGSRIPHLMTRPDFHSAPWLGTYFLRININKPPFDNIEVRKALYLAINRQVLVKHITKGGEDPAYSLVPSFLAKYNGPKGPSFNPEQAVWHIRKAGYCGPKPHPENCKPFPEFEIMYNTHEKHQRILEALQQMWKMHLGIENIKLLNVEWKTYLRDQKNRNYQVSRSSWMADIPDASNFLEIFRTGTGNNRTGWSNTNYDDLLHTASLEANNDARLKILAQAEAILLAELPIIPIFYYTSSALVSTNVAGFYDNYLDHHPLKSVFISSSGILSTKPTGPQ